MKLLRFSILHKMEKTRLTVLGTFEESPLAWKQSTQNLGWDQANEGKLLQALSLCLKLGGLG